MDSNWIKRRWYDFRNGHAMYLIYGLTGANFVLSFHRLLIERVPALNEVFSNLWFFAVVLIFSYIPISIAIGVWHRKNQLKIDQEQIFRRNPPFARMFRIMMDIQTGKASEDEIENARKFLKSIEEGKG